MPVDARLNTIDSACSTERLSASLLEMSGTGAPGRTATPSPTRPTSTRSAATLPSLANSSSAAGGAITTSNTSPPPMRLSISGVVLNAIFTSWPDCLRNAAAAALSPGSIAPALNTLISAATAVPATAHNSNAVQCLISGLPETEQITTASFGAGARIFHDLRPFRNLARDIVGELPRRACGDFRAERLEPLAQVRQAQHLDDVAVEPLDERRGRTPRHDNAVPGDRLEPGYARLGQGRQLGHRRRTPGGRDRERAQPPGLDVGNHRSRGREHELRLTGDDVGERRLRALVGHVHHIDSRHRLEEFSGEVRGRAAPRGRVIELARPRFRQGDQLLHRARGNVRIHDEDVGLDRHQRDRREVLHRIVAEAAVQALIGRENAVVAEEPGGAVGRALRDELGGDVAARARPVLDHHLLAPKAGELLAQGAREDVARTSGGEADDEAHRLPRPALGTGSARKRESDEQGGGDAFHGLLLLRT